MIIGITQREQADPATGELRDALDSRWHVFAEAAGFMLQPLPNHVPTVSNLLDALPVSGLIFSGGGDTDTVSGQQSRRGAVETFLIKWSVDHRIPVLGVCRGFQRLAEEYGATFKRTPGHVATDHPVRDPLGALDTINSYHDITIEEPGLRMTSIWTAPDGTVEAATSMDGLRTGIMWHPERYASPRRQDLSLLASHFHRGPSQT
jgi:gamma-glutamyl-gamma-aminobutyrate hydrolase PuuD